MTPLMSWLKKWASKDQRRAERLQWPPLVAHYWTGGAPAAQKIRDISSTGFYLLTDTRWYPGTIVKITLQSAENLQQLEGDQHASRSTISVQSRVIRRDADGVGLEFVLPGALEQAGQSCQDVVTDQQSLDRFLEQLKANDGDVHFDVEK